MGAFDWQIWISILKSGFRISKQNAKSKNRFGRTEILFQDGFQLRPLKSILEKEFGSPKATLRFRALLGNPKSEIEIQISQSKAPYDTLGNGGV